MVPIDGHCKWEPLAEFGPSSQLPDFLQNGNSCPARLHQPDEQDLKLRSS
jgi:hypothetical protein